MRPAPRGPSGYLTSLVERRLQGAGSATPEGPVRGLLDREALRDLVLLYATAVDDHDLEALAMMFHPDAVLDRDGVVATGWPAIAETLSASMSGFQRMVHTPHAAVVDVAGETGVGSSSGHAELVTRSGVVLTAYRYHDRYARHAGRWVFAARTVRFLYASPVAGYAAALASSHQVRFPGETARATRVQPAAVARADRR